MDFFDLIAGSAFILYGLYQAFAGKNKQQGRGKAKVEDRSILDQTSAKDNSTPQTVSPNREERNEGNLFENPFEDLEQMMKEALGESEQETGVSEEQTEPAARSGSIRPGGGDRISMKTTLETNQTLENAPSIESQQADELTMPTYDTNLEDNAAFDDVIADSEMQVTKLESVTKGKPNQKIINLVTDPESLKRAIIAKEILDRPKALRNR